MGNFIVNCVNKCRYRFVWFIRLSYVFELWIGSHICGIKFIFVYTDVSVIRYANFNMSHDSFMAQAYC